jgi:hypothetical protein
MPGLIGLVVGRGFGLLVITGRFPPVGFGFIGFMTGLIGVGVAIPLPGLIGIVVGRLTGLTPCGLPGFIGLPGVPGACSLRLTPCAVADLVPLCDLPGFIVLILFVSFIAMLLTLLG